MMENRLTVAKDWSGVECEYKWEAWESVLGVIELFCIRLWWWVDESICVLEFLKLYIKKVHFNMW